MTRCRSGRGAVAGASGVVKAGFCVWIGAISTCSPCTAFISSSVLNSKPPSFTNSAAANCKCATRPVRQRPHLVLHLHGFQNHHHVASANSSAKLHQPLDDGGLKRGADGGVLHGCILGQGVAGASSKAGQGGGSVAVRRILQAPNANMQAGWARRRAACTRSGGSRAQMCL